MVWNIVSALSSNDFYGSDRHIAFRHSIQNWNKRKDIVFRLETREYSITLVPLTLSNFIEALCNFMNTDCWDLEQAIHNLCISLLTLCMLGNFFKYLFLSKFSKNSLIPHNYFADIYSECQTIWISDEAPHFVGLHLDPNCLQRSSTVFKIHR